MDVTIIEVPRQSGLPGGIARTSLPETCIVQFSDECGDDRGWGLVATFRAPVSGERKTKRIMVPNERCDGEDSLATWLVENIAGIYVDGEPYWTNPAHVDEVEVCLFAIEDETEEQK